MTTHRGSAKLTVKVYINPDTDRQEIRRLVFDKGQLAINYSTLEENVKRVFPHLRGTYFKLSWKGEFNIICVVSRLKSKNLAPIEFHARTRSNAFKKKQTYLLSHFQNISNST